MDTEHPALKNFNSFIEGGKHIGGKILKYGLMTAVGFAIAPAIVTAIFSKVAVTSFFSTTGLVAGALVGAIAGISSVGKAVDEEKQRAIDDYEYTMLSRERANLLARGRGQSFANSEVAVGNVAYRAPEKKQGMAIS